jgi:hypothetical protein
MHWNELELRHKGTIVPSGSAQVGLAKIRRKAAGKPSCSTCRWNEALLALPQRIELRPAAGPFEVSPGRLLD